MDYQLISVLYVKSIVLGIILSIIFLAIPLGLPRGRKGVKFREIFSSFANINWVSFAREFLFGARDARFIVVIPIYFYAILSYGSEAGSRSTFSTIGTFMTFWISFYGIIQAKAPTLLKAI